jgi:protein involved in polysaccharide export with SLBB domain
MRLRDLLFKAGGPLPEAYHIVEIARARGEETVILQVDLDRLLFERDESQNVLLEDGDLISVRSSRLYRLKPDSVLLQGEVKVPGTYAIRKGERLVDVIRRAQGLTDRAFPEGGILIRRIDQMITQEQRQIALETQRRLMQLTELEYLALSTVQRIQQRRGSSRITIPSISGSTNLSTTVVSTLVAAQAAEQLAGLTKPEAEVAAPPRGFQLLNTGRLAVDFVEALRNPEGPENVELRDGDIIIIPRRPENVMVEGAVIKAQALRYREDWTIEQYIDQCGGYSPPSV